MKPVLANVRRMNPDPSRLALRIPIQDSREAGADLVAARETSPRRTMNCLSRSNVADKRTSPGALRSVVFPAHSPTSQSSAEKSGLAGSGIEYVAGSGSSISAVNRWVLGEYLDQPADVATLTDNKYQEQENGFNSTWNITGKSTVVARLSWYARRYQNFSVRNFSGPRGQITYTLGSAADKLRLSLGYTREIAAYITDQSSYTITNTVSLIPTWQATQKIAVHMDFERATWSYRGPVFVEPTPFRGDTVLSALAGVDWTPFRNVTLGASAQRSHRSSNIFTDEYNDTSVTVNASLKF